jgi:hypothetical protein
MAFLLKPNLLSGTFGHIAQGHWFHFCVCNWAFVTKMSLLFCLRLQVPVPSCIGLVGAFLCVTPSYWLIRFLESPWHLSCSSQQPTRLQKHHYFFFFRSSIVEWVATNGTLQFFLWLGELKWLIAKKKFELVRQAHLIERWMGKYPRNKTNKYTKWWSSRLYRNHMVWWSSSFLLAQGHSKFFPP